VESCDAQDSLSTIFITPFVSPSPIIRPNSCSIPNEGPSPDFYQGPWSPSASDLGAQNATFNLLLPCTNPDCGDGGIINEFYSSGNEAFMSPGGIATIDEVFDATSIIFPNSIVYRSSCNRLPCRTCESINGPDDPPFRDIWVLDPFATAIVAGGNGVNINAAMRFSRIQCNCGEQ